MNEDITFTTLLDRSWMKTEANVMATKQKIAELRRELSRHEEYLKSHEREFEQLQRFCNDYSRPFDDVIVTEESITNFKANLKAAAKGNSINVEASKVEASKVDPADLVDLAAQGIKKMKRRAIVLPGNVKITIDGKTMKLVGEGFGSENQFLE